MSMGALLATAALCILAGPALAQEQYFTIEVVDEATGRGVPLVDLSTVNNIHYWTDSNGIVAFHEPGLMDQTVFFSVASHGYEFPADGFGYRGVAVDVTPGGKTTLKLRRINVAERLYRITGAGIYRDSVLVGAPARIAEPSLNGRVFGQDSVLLTEFRGKLYWFWGDTSRPAYPLGNFHVAGATSQRPADGGLAPGTGVDLTYFVDGKGFAKEMARMAGDGPTWLGGLTVLRDDEGREQMLASFVKVRQDMSAHRRGIVQWDEESEAFRETVDLGGTEPAIFLSGHTFQHNVAGQAYVYSGNPYPFARVRADVPAFLDPGQYEAFTCLKAGSGETPELDRDIDGSLCYGWKRGVPALDWKAQAELVKAGKMREDEGLLQLRDADSGKAVTAASGSVYFNEYRNRWVMITTEIFGTSLLGEVWYAEGDSPLGPWVYARKVVTHDHYSFYNPLHHPVFDEGGGRFIHFEGTYTKTFSGNENPTPRYEYNQMMYRLDLADPRLVLPVAVYAPATAEDGQRLATLSDLAGGAEAEIICFAPDRPAPGTVPVSRSEDGTLRAGRDAAPDAVFYALPADMEAPPATTVELREYAGPEGQLAYATGENPPPPGFKDAGRVVCRVWEQPMSITVPRE